mmetsp:Transcript_41363/g.66296  ORF Transcript_41363/g.66296 Transcript_41363/m.66296 type:complete len:260 (-) Transcript_41363:251-1030(-)
MVVHRASTQKQQRALRPIVMCGPSGVGKGTLIQKLMDDFPGRFGFSVSHTTRAPRPGEEDGVHYNFVNKVDMEAEIAAGKFLEHANVHENIYGTSLASVRKVAAAGAVCILDIDVQGAEIVKQSALDAVYVFVSPPSMPELEKRLRGRGTEKEASIQTRMTNARKEMAKTSVRGFFHKVIVNDNLDKAYAQLCRVIDKEILAPQKRDGGKGGFFRDLSLPFSRVLKSLGASPASIAPMIATAVVVAVAIGGAAYLKQLR